MFCDWQQKKKTNKQAIIKTKPGPEKSPDFPERGGGLGRSFKN
jgi:hypothetical protein